MSESLRATPAASLLEGRIPVRSVFDQGYNKGLESAAKQGATPVAFRSALRSEVIRVIDKSLDTGALNPDDVVDSLLAAGVFREPPTLEQIAKAIHAGYCVHAWDRCGLGHQDDARVSARQVDALMGGTEEETK